MHKTGLANTNIETLADGKRGISIEGEKTRQNAVSLRASDGIREPLQGADLPVIDLVRAVKRPGADPLRLPLAYHPGGAGGTAGLPEGDRDRPQRLDGGALRRAGMAGLCKRAGLLPWQRVPHGRQHEKGADAPHRPPAHRLRGRDGLRQGAKDRDRGDRLHRDPAGAQPAGYGRRDRHAGLHDGHVVFI